MRTEKNSREVRTGASTSILSATPSVRDRAGGSVSGSRHDHRHLRPRSGRFAHHHGGDAFAPPPDEPGEFPARRRLPAA
jgi:hypothetical protein